MIARRWLEVVFFAFVAALASHQIFDPDFWLHLAAGQRMWETGAVLRTNTFSFTHPDHPWTNVYWLYQLALSAAWQAAGPTGIVALRLVLALTLAALVVYGFRDGRAPLTAGELAVLLLTWPLLAPRLTERPELVSFVLLAATLALARRGRWWWAVPLQLIWANSQGYFVWQPVVLALAAVSEWAAGRRRAAGSAALAAAVSAALTMVSPFGWRNPQLALEFGRTMRWFGGVVEELVSPFHPLARATDGTGWWLVVVLVAAGVVGYRRRATLTLLDWLPALATLPLALTVRRAVPLFVICLLPGLWVTGFDSRRWRWLLTGVAAVLVAGFYRGEREWGWQVRTDAALPGAAAFLRELPAEARVLNTAFHTGGWLAAHGRAVFVDGRLEAYPVEFLRGYLATTDGFAALAEKYRITHLWQTGPTRAVAPPGWPVVYEDAWVTVRGASLAK